MSGLELCQALRRTDAGRKTYVLILTAREEEDRIVDAFHAGADDYVTKPFNPRILLARVPGISATLANQIARFVALIRKEDLKKAPGVAESIDWAAALVGLGSTRIDGSSQAVLESLMCLVKTREDQGNLSRDVAERLIGKVA